MSYIAAWVDGHEAGVGLRDAAKRYAAIRDYLKGTNAQPGFTVLDWGSYNGYHCARLRDDFDARCTAVDDDPNLQPMDGVTIIHRRIGPSEIRRLGPVDVVLALSVLHHLGQWKNYLNALQNITDLLFVESAHPDEVLPYVDTHRNSAAIQAEIVKRGGRALVQTPGWDSRQLRTLWVLT